jgi:hypothetical protein
MDSKINKYRVTYKIYNQQYVEDPQEISVVINENPWVYIERIKADLAMNDPYKQIGSYNIQPIIHLKVIK